MSIMVNEGGVLYELETITANEGGVLYELDTVHANEGGVLQEIFSAWRAPSSLSWVDILGTVTATGSYGFIVGSAGSTSSPEFFAKNITYETQAVGSKAVNLKKGTVIRIDRLNYVGDGATKHRTRIFIYDNDMNTPKSTLETVSLTAAVPLGEYTVPEDGLYYIGINSLGETGGQYPQYFKGTSSVKFSFSFSK